MATFTTLRRRKGFSFDDINITPLTDIFLVLLIIMMVVAPTLNQQQQSIKLPSVQTGSPVNPEWITVEVDKAMHYTVQGKPVEPTALVEALKQAALTSHEKKVVLRADEASKSDALLTVMQASAEAGLDKLVMAAIPLNNQAPTANGEAPSSDPL
jgi:biopolymer transport protein ExbD/biopolymer transport protein TolR